MILGRAKAFIGFASGLIDYFCMSIEKEGNETDVALQCITSSNSALFVLKVRIVICLTVTGASLST